MAPFYFHRQQRRGALLTLHAWQDLRALSRQIVKSSDHRGEGCTCVCCGGGRGALGARQNGAVFHPTNTAGTHTANGRPRLTFVAGGGFGSLPNPAHDANPGGLFRRKGKGHLFSAPHRGFIGAPASALSPASNTASGATQSQMPRLTRRARRPSNADAQNVAYKWFFS